MANEATLLFALEPAIPFTCSNSTGIEKGSLLKLTDPMTAALSATAEEMLAGIAVEEKIANDGKTQIPVIVRGIVKMYASGAINVGQAVASAADANFPNYVKQAAVTCSGAAILGHALETAANGETFRVFVDVGAGGNQIS